MSATEGLPRPTDAELGVLRVLWEIGPATVRQLHRTMNEKRETRRAATAAARPSFRRDRGCRAAGIRCPRALRSRPRVELARPRTLNTQPTQSDRRQRRMKCIYSLFAIAGTLCAGPQPQAGFGSILEQAEDSARRGDVAEAEKILNEDVPIWRQRLHWRAMLAAAAAAASSPTCAAISGAHASCSWRRSNVMAESVRTRLPRWPARSCSWERPRCGSSCGGRRRTHCAAR